ncbi:Ran-specific GTPase-activating protein [Hondaea fermentalgiana]|uniref:Ran-specific GTPase-activating protein n=1 Tax=Hondaea fermentalgiana TaxID=2315210 RepID=A0A2R5GH12_9STRA|nr:Ran-specific GTPase-activating protein [Hondaea fermentalgiana]|eukprot:GBG29885.1 Ran-specific GTPase-activating protein [Hondaea fermentalgiana]
MSEAEAQNEAGAAFEGADEAAGEATEFTPKYNMEKVEVKTMEEDEEVCFKQRSKLFVFVAEDIYGGEVRKNWWKERGTGDVKLLKHKEMGKVRLLMRQEKTLKICANHLVSPHVELKSNVGSDRSWVFTASDFADEELKTETFAIKFSSSEIANLFKEKLELAKAINGGSKEASELKPVEDEGDESASIEKKAIDKQIDERNKREEVRRDSVAAQNAAEDSDHDSQAEDVTEGAEDRLKQTVGAPSSAADGLSEDLSKMSLPGVPGGYKEADTETPEVKEAADFAAKEIGKGDLVKIEQAAQQVVAGINFHLVLHIKHEDDALHSYTATVFKPLPHENKPLQLSESKHNGAV